jgi:hypothetical protein
MSTLLSTTNTLPSLLCFHNTPSPVFNFTFLHCTLSLTGVPCYHTIPRVLFLPSALVSNEDSPGGQGNSFRRRSESIHISGLCYGCGVTIHVLLLSNIRIVDLGNFNPPRKYTRLGRQRGSWAMLLVGAAVMFRSGSRSELDPSLCLAERSPNLHSM